MDSAEASKTQGYAPVNGLTMYYEIEGTGDPLVFIHPILGFGGIHSCPALVRGHRVISVDLQGHGRTADLPERPLSIEHFAQDIVALLKHLHIPRADFFGESYGAAVAMMIAIHHPELVARVVTYGGSFGPAKHAHNLDMLRFDSPPNPDSKSFRFQRDSYKRVAPDPGAWPGLWKKAVAIVWDGFSEDQLRSIQAPVLVAIGDRDFIRVEHALETFRRIPHAELAVIPDAGHFALFSEPERLLHVVLHFLEKPATRRPVATADMGFQPGETR